MQPSSGDNEGMMHVGTGGHGNVVGSGRESVALQVLGYASASHERDSNAYANAKVRRGCP